MSVIVSATSTAARAMLTPWRCDGERCTRLLAYLDASRPSFLQIKCPSCGHVSTWVEAYRTGNADVGV